MAVKTSWYAIDSNLGINFNQTYTSVVNVASNVADSNTAPVSESQQQIAPDLLGTARKGTDESEWVLLKASTTITQFNLIMWDDSYNANNFTTAGALSGNQVGLCQVQTYGGVTATSVDPGANPVFWAMIRGVGAQVAVSGSAATGVQLNTGGAAGQVSVSTTGTALHGVVLYASAGASGAVECLVLYPHVTAFT